jgi:pyruvate decarboxylase
MVSDVETVSFPGVADSLEASDLVVNIGPVPSDSNTGGFTREIKDKHLVWLGHDFCQVQDTTYDNVHFLPVLKKLVAALRKDSPKYKVPRPLLKPKVEVPILNATKSGNIEQSYCWQRLGKFLRKDDILLVESGTAQFGMPDSIFPANVRLITQTFWSSIGYTVGACFGAMLAAKEMRHPGRVVLIVGEGSLQMTVQEIGSYVRYGLKPIIFVINNNGYAIERAIHGPEQNYNDVSAMWDYQKMLEFFGARQDLGVQSKSRAAKTVEELEAVLNDESFASGKTYQVSRSMLRHSVSADISSSAKSSWMALITLGD